MTFLTPVAVVWGQWKNAIEIFLGLSADAVHVQVGVLMLLFWAVATKRRLYNGLPWCLVLLIECINELIDMSQPEGSVESNWPASQHDILNTMFLPTVLILMLRWRNQSFLRPVPHD